MTTEPDRPRNHRPGRPGWPVLMAEVGRDLVAGDGSADHLQEVFARIGDALGFEILLHYQPCERPRGLKLVACSGLPPALREQLREITFGEYVCGAVALRRERLVLEKLDETPIAAAAELRAFGVRCYVGVPLLAEGDLLGTLAFATTTRATARARQLELVDAFGRQVASQLARLREQRELERASAALHATNRRKDEFLAILAHELRNPLAPIHTAAQTLKLTSRDDPNVGRACEIIDRQVAHLVGLVDDLLDVARIGRGKLALKSERIDLVAVVQHAIEVCRPQLAAARHELAVSMPQAPCTVAGDFTRLTQVVSNLIGNAVKFTPQGGRIDVVVEREGKSAVIRVRDNGRGMDEATLANVFDMFYQGPRDGERPGPGLGIGLALVKSLVTLHRGQIRAVSEGRGRGSEFIVRLPCAGDPAGAKSTSAADRAESSRARKGPLREPPPKLQAGPRPTRSARTEDTQLLARALHPRDHTRS